MIDKPDNIHSSLISRVAQEYERLGYKVIIEPKVSDLPFDLASYPGLAGNENGKRRLHH